MTKNDKQHVLDFIKAQDEVATTRLSGWTEDDFRRVVATIEKVETVDPLVESRNYNINLIHNNLGDEYIKSFERSLDVFIADWKVDGLNSLNMETETFYEDEK